jgi:hypothetical protein|tara:strand:- start:593 stop:772 length:180 start_codon:yes stop_codon:yes gene_type:complete
MKEPKDLGVKIGTKAQVEWTDLKRGQEEALLKSEINVIVAKDLIALADKHIALEKEKLK